MRKLLSPNVLLIPICLLMIFVCVKIFCMDFPITNFDNLTLGMATAKNIDISKLILCYVIYAFPMCLLFAWIFSKSNLYDEVKKFLGKIESQKDASTFFLMTILLSFVIFTYPDINTSILAVCFIAIAFFSRYAEKALVGWVVSIYIFALPLFYLSQYVDYFEYVLMIFIIATSIIFCLTQNFSFFFAKMYLFLIAAISSLLLLNVLEILLVRGYSVSDKILIVPYLLATIACILTKPIPEKNYERKIIHGAIFLMVLLFTPVLGNDGYVDFFEGANHGLSIQRFVEYGELPLIENLDAHMLFPTLSGIIWFALTGDYIGSMFYPYTDILAMLIELPCFFYLITRFLTEQETFILIAFFPLFELMALFPGLVVILPFLYWKQKPNFFRSLLLQITISTLCLCKIDLGVSFGAALFIVPILFCLIKKNYTSLREYFLAVVLWVALFFSVVFFGLHFEFAKEFLTAFNSNQHWAYGDLGLSNRVIFIYFIVPAITAILFLGTVKRIWNNREVENDWLILFLYVTFIFGINRMMVRHIFVEWSTSTYAVEILLFTLLIVNLCKEYRAVIFTGVFFLAVATCTNFNQTSLLIPVKNVAAAVNSVHHEQRQYFSSFKEEDITQIENMKTFFDENLRNDETYFDFTNQSLFFAAVGRKNPIYINQCPAMINGVKGQLQALEELKNSKIKFIVMPYLQRPNVEYSCYTRIDGILNSDRYYLLTEWICANYQPYKQIGNFFVWKAKDFNASEILNYNYELPESHFHNLGYIPQILGNSSFQSEKKKFLQTKQARGI